MAEKLCKLRKYVGGGSTNSDVKEVFTAHRHSGGGSGYTICSADKIIGEYGDISATLINSVSNYFNASGTTLTAVQPCRVVQYELLNVNNGIPTVTEHNLGVGDTITIHTTLPARFVEAIIVYGY